MLGTLYFTKPDTLSVSSTIHCAQRQRRPTALLNFVVLREIVASTQNLDVRRVF
jgi:hypothetical protein